MSEERGGRVAFAGLKMNANMKKSLTWQGDLAISKPDRRPYKNQYQKDERQSLVFVHFRFECGYVLLRGSGMSPQVRCIDGTWQDVEISNGTISPK